MSNDFTKKYFQPCVNNFVSTVLLIDDQLVYSESAALPIIKSMKLKVPVQGGEYISSGEVISSTSTDSKRKVNVTDLIKYFSKEGLLVTPINPQSIGADNGDECIKILLDLAEKADVIILDWDMDVFFSSKDHFTSNELSKKLIERLNSDNKYRLVIIYTADTKKSVQEKIPLLKNIGIRIYGKSETTGTVVKKYDELAKQVNKDFLSEKKGLLGLSILTALTDLRRSTYSMLNILKTSYDEALIYHRILLTDPIKVADFGREIIKDELLSHLSHQAINNCLQKDVFKDFIDENKIKLKIQKDKTEKRKELASDELDKILDFGYKSFFDKETSDMIAKGKYLDYIIPEDDLSKLKEFSYYSLMISNDIKPNLQLGCITRMNNNYYLCIQPLCDSERLPTIDELQGKDPPNFLFLGLEKEKSKMDFFIKDDSKYIGLRIDYSNVVTMPVCGNVNGVVALSKGRYKLLKKKTMVYITCLKPMFAQKIANNFAANISRVGIDQFEWLRLKGRK